MFYLNYMMVTVVEGEHAYNTVFYHHWFLCLDDFSTVEALISDFNSLFVCSWSLQHQLSRVPAGPVAVLRAHLSFLNVGFCEFPE